MTSISAGSHFWLEHIAYTQGPFAPFDPVLDRYRVDFHYLANQACQVSEGSPQFTAKGIEESMLLGRCRLAIVFSPWVYARTALHLRPPVEWRGIVFLCLSCRVETPGKAFTVLSGRNVLN